MEETRQAEELSQAALADFYKDAADRFGEWVKYGDTNAGAVFVLLGLGLSNLRDTADALIAARRDPSDSGLAAGARSRRSASRKGCSQPDTIRTTLSWSSETFSRTLISRRRVVRGRIRRRARRLARGRGGRAWRRCARRVS